MPQLRKKRWMLEFEEKPFYYILSLFILCSGIACGITFPRFIALKEQTALTDLVLRTLRMSASSAPAVLQTLLTTIWTNLRIMLSIAVAGFLRFGHPVAAAAMGVKGLGMGVLIYAFSAGIGGRGTIAAIVYLLPQSICYLPAYVHLCANSLFRSTALYRHQAGANSRYLNRALLCFAAIAVGIMIECMISPKVLQMLLPLL